MPADRADFTLALRADSLIRNARRSRTEIDKLVASMARLGAAKDPLSGRVPPAARRRSEVPTAARAPGAATARSRAPSTAGIDREFSRMLRERERAEKAAQRQSAKEAAQKARETARAVKLEETARRQAQRQGVLAVRLADRQRRQMFLADKRAAADSLKGFNLRAALVRRQQRQEAAAVKQRAAAAKVAARQQEKAHKEQQAAVKRANDLLQRSQNERAARGGGGVASAAALTAVKTAAIAAAAAVVAVGGAFAFMTVNSARFAQSSRFAFTQLLGDAGKASKEFDDVRRIAQEMALPVEDTVDGFRKLIAAQFEIGQAKDLIKMSGDLQAIGASAEEAQRAIFTITQIKSKGRLQGEELLQLQEAGLSGELVFKQLEKKLGKDRDAVQRALSAGEIGADVAIASIMDAVKAKTGVANFGDAGKSFADSTLDGFLGQMGARLTNFTIDLGDKLMPTLMKTARAIVPGIDSILSMIDDMATSLVNDPNMARIGDALMAGFSAGIEFLKENFPAIKQVVQDAIGKAADVIDAFRERWPAIQRVIKAVASEIGFFVGIAMKISSVGQSVGKFLFDVWLAGVNLILDGIDRLKKVVQPLIEFMRKAAFEAAVIFQVAKEMVQGGPDIEGRKRLAEMARATSGASFADGMRAGESAAESTLQKVQQTGQAVEAIFGKQEAANQNRGANPFGLAEGNTSGLEWMRAAEAARIDVGQMVADIHKLTGTDGMPSPLAPRGADQAAAGAVNQNQTNNLTAPITVNLQLAELADGTTLAQRIRREIDAALDKLSNND